jgi:hypothetical protein
MEGDVIRGGAGGGGERGVWQREAPFRVDQNAVQPSQDGRILLVRPSELAIKKRNLEEAEIIDEPVKKVSLRRVKVPIRFIAGGPDEVEITYDGCRPRDSSEDLR